MTTSHTPGCFLPLSETLSSYFRHKDNVVAVYLFGSYARGKEWPSSDMDIGVLLDTENQAITKELRIKYMTELGRILRKDIHPVILNSAGEELMRQIFQKGKCVLVNDRKKHAHFKMTMFSRIAAFDYYRRQMQQGLVRKIMEETSSGRS